MSLSKFGPFQEVFAASESGVPGYLELLHLAEPSAQGVIDRIERALSGDDSRRWIDALFDDPNWRPHLVGAIALILGDGRDWPMAGLWRAVDAGSWVTPQLVVSAYLADADFADQCRRRLVDAPPVSPPLGLSPLERHSATGPANARQRSAKVMAALVAMGGHLASMSDWVRRVSSTPAIANVISADVDSSGGIAEGWLSAVTRQFAIRGRALKPKAR